MGFFDRRWQEVDSSPFKVYTHAEARSTTEVAIAERPFSKKKYTFCRVPNLQFENARATRRGVCMSNMSSDLYTITRTCIGSAALGKDHCTHTVHGAIVAAF